MFTLDTIKDCPLLFKEWISRECGFDIEKIFIGLNNGILVPKTDPYIILQDIGSVKLEFPEYNIKNQTITELVGKRFQCDFYRCEDIVYKFYLKIGSYYVPEWGNFIKYHPPINTTTVSSESRYLNSFTMTVTIAIRVTMDNVVDQFNTVLLKTKNI